MTNDRAKVSLSLLHHHPLPLPIPDHKGNNEPFLTLINSYSFLYYAILNKIDLVLNGHEHVGGVSEFKIKEWLCDYDHQRSANRSLQVISCASSAKVKAETRSARLLKISDSGAITSTVYELKNKNCFVRGRDVIIVNYSEQRRHLTEELIKSDFERNVITNINSKSKQVKLMNDGTATVFMNYSGIRWTNGLSDDKMVIYETLRSDIGRVKFGLSGLYPEGNADYALKGWQDSRAFDEKKLVEQEEILLKVEAIKKDLLRNDYLAHCEIKYMYFNGFVLTKEMFKEVIGGDYTDVPREFCTIEAVYPTELLELKIIFPCQEYMPSKKQVALLAIKKNKKGEVDFNDIRKGDYSLNYEEQEFLEKEMALRYYGDGLELSLVVKYPQLGVLYLIIWDLPNSERSAKLTKNQQYIANELKNRFSDPNDPSVEKIYKTIVDIFMNKGVSVMIIGIDSNINVMRVVKGAEQVINKEFRTGRGLAGKALRSKKYQFYKQDAKYGTQVEEIYDGFKPNAVLSIPLDLYGIIACSDDGGYEDENRLDYPVFALINLYAFNEIDFFTEFGLPEDKIDKRKIEHFLVSLYRTVYGLIKENFLDLLGRKEVF